MTNPLLKAQTSQIAGFVVLQPKLTEPAAKIDKITKRKIKKKLHVEKDYELCLIFGVSKS